MTAEPSAPLLPRAQRTVTLLTYLMFFMFAMTTESIGEVIKIAKQDMGLSNLEASALHWTTMLALAISGISLGYLADKYGRKFTVIAGLAIYGIACVLFLFFDDFAIYLVLLFCSGVALGMFKTAALAVIGDITSSADQHTSQMNMVEGFFGVGAILGPLLIVLLEQNGLPWNWLYGIAALMCLLMIILAGGTRYPPMKPPTEKIDLSRTFSFLTNRYALGFSMGCAMYVGCEVAIFVWLPSFLVGFEGGAMQMLFATYAVMIFFILRAIGRFLGVWLLSFLDWKQVIFAFSTMIFLCFFGSAVFGKSVAIIALPLSGLFMSVIYPTLNSKGISCFYPGEHGSVAGLILFFTAVSAAVAPVLMAVTADLLGGGDLRVGFYLATGFAAILMLMAIFNMIVDPAGPRLRHLDEEASEGL